MDIEKLIETLRQHGVSCVRAHGRYCSICDEAAATIATLQAENKKLRETVDKYATAARVIALHLKPFCDESLPYDEMIADAARKASDELEQVKREKDAAVSWVQKYTESIDMPCVACKHNTGDYVCTAICGNCGPMGAESCKWEFDFSGELKED